jgi:ribonuclease HI
MTPEIPHYLLLSEASQNSCSAQTWRFVLQHVESQRRLSVTDTEPLETGSERLELLAVVRGLEALDEPARVTLVTKSRYVSRGIKHCLSEWRANDWRWERFGRLVHVRDHDLWRRVDRALRFHEVDCQAWQFDCETGVRQAPETPRCRSSRHVRGNKLGRLRGVWAGLSERSNGSWAACWSDAFSAVARPVRHAVGTAG